MVSKSLLVTCSLSVWTCFAAVLLEAIDDQVLWRWRDVHPCVARLLSGGGRTCPYYLDPGNTTKVCDACGGSSWKNAYELANTSSTGSRPHVEWCGPTNSCMDQVTYSCAVQ